MRIVTKLVISVYLLLLFISAMIVLLPEQSATPLVAKNDWKVQGDGLRPAHSGPREIETRRAILSSPATAFYRSYPRSTKAIQGRVISSPFKPPRFIAIPYSGFPYDSEQENDLFLECLENGAKHTVARANAHHQWSEAVFAIQENWCQSEIVLIAHTENKRYYLAFGTPFSISRLSYLKTRGIGQIFAHFVVFVVLFQIGLIGVLIWGRLGLPGAAFTVHIITVGILGYVTFFVLYLSPEAGLILSWSVPLSAPIVIAIFLLFDPLFLKKKVSGLKWSTMVWFLGSLFFILLLYSVNNRGSSWSSNYRFSPANWPSDNQIALNITQAFAHRQDIKKFSMGNWMISDRPQLLTGIVSLLRPFLLFLQGNNNGPHLFHHAYHITGITMMSLWLPAVFFLLSRAGLTTRRHQLFVLLIITLSPLSLLNSTYISPKMLSGAFGVMAFCYLLVPTEETNNGRLLDSALVAASVLCVLSLMSHGGGFFAIVVMGLWGFIKYFYRRLHAVTFAALLGLLLLSPWLLWQKFVQPPGNALVKFAFAGTYGFDEKEMSLLDTVLRTYSDAGFRGWLDLRWQALLTLFGAGDSAQDGRILSAARWAEGAFDILRWRDYFFFFPTVIVFIFLAAAVLVLGHRALISEAGNQILMSASRRMIGVALGSYVATILLLWKFHVIFVFPYPAHILLLSGSLSGLFALGNQKLAISAGALLGAYSIVVWILDPIKDAIQVDWFSFGLLICCLLLVVTFLFSRDRLPQ